MMLFNGTLIVQMGNFLITYWFLNTFFLKQGFIAVSTENQEMDSLQDSIVTYKKVAYEALQKKEQAWHGYSTALRSEKPQSIVQQHVGLHIEEKPRVVLEPFSQKTFAELTAILVKRVIHD